MTDIPLSNNSNNSNNAPQTEPKISGPKVYQRAEAARHTRTAEALAKATADAAQGETPAPGAERQEGTVAAQQTATAAPPQPPANLDPTDLYLAAQKAQRKAAEEAKRSRELAERAQSFQAATSKWEEDPTALLRAAGIDPNKYFEKLVIYGANNQAPQSDPVADKVKEAVQPYIQALEDRDRQAQEQAERNEEAQVISQQVLPMMQNGAANYPTLLRNFDRDPVQAAIAIFGEVKRHYDKTGEIVSFDEVAEKMEAYYEKRVKQVIESSRDIDKFASCFAPASTPGINSNSKPSQTNSLAAEASANQSASQSESSLPNRLGSKRLSRQEEKVARTLRKLGL